MCEYFLAKMFDKIYFIFIKYMEYSFMRKVNSLTNLNEILIYQTINQSINQCLFAKYKYKR